MAITLSLSSPYCARQSPNEINPIQEGGGFYLAIFRIYPGVEIETILIGFENGASISISKVQTGILG